MILQEETVVVLITPLITNNLVSITMVGIPRMEGYPSLRAPRISFYIGKITHTGAEKLRYAGASSIDNDRVLLGWNFFAI